MKKYSPFSQPKAEEWLALDEQSRIDIVAKYHRQVKQKLPNVKLHSSFHVVVENQLAEALPEVVNALRRLMDEGMDRHDAIHAIGWVLANHMHSMMSGDTTGHNMEEEYFHDLNELTEESWHRGLQ